MDIATIIGLLLANGLIGAACAGGAGGLMLFYDLPSVLIVFGGAIGCLFISYPLGDILSLWKVCLKTVFYKQADRKTLIALMVEFSSKARKEGILTLENELGRVEDQFFQKGVRLAVDGHEISEIDAIMQTDIDQQKDRHKKGADMLGIMAALFPAMGLIGTLVGLVQMLQNMSDPSSIGPAMAVALITTFYGAIAANVFLIPMGGKLKTRSAMEVSTKDLMKLGVLAIAAGNNPRVVEEKLMAYLPPKERSSSFDKGGGEEK